MIPLEIDHITKRYGAKTAVDDLSLNIAEGTVFGLLGRNGAGKSTTISCSLGLLRHDQGTIRLFGEPLRPATFDRIGYVPELTVLDTWMTPRQHATFRKRMFSRFDDARMASMCEQFEIDPRRKVGKLSKGQRQAVALALAFAQRPDLLILDEPASGLDPVLQRRLLDAIVTTAADGCTIVFSSHQIGHVEQAAERIGIMDRGRLVLEADLDDVRAQRSVIEAVFARASDLESLRTTISAPMTIEGSLVRVYADGNSRDIEAALRAREPVAVSQHAMTLETLFFSTISTEART